MSGGNQRSAPQQREFARQAARLLVKSRILQPGSRVGIAATNPETVSKLLMPVGCFSSICYPGAGTLQAAIRQRVDRLAEVGRSFDAALIADSPDAADLSSIITEFARGLCTRGYLAIYCSPVHGQSTESNDPVDTELRSGAVGRTGAALFAKLGLDLTDCRSAANGPPGWLFLFTKVSNQVAAEGGVEMGIIPERNLLVDVDPTYSVTYAAAMQRTGTPDAGHRRRDRFYNLLQLVDHTHHLPGKIIECGCWRGLSARLICLSSQTRDPNYRGDDLVICDSFQGLSAPTSADLVTEAITHRGRSLTGTTIKDAGSYAADLDHVRGALSEFSEIHFHKGWIPDSLNALPEATYRFAHVDLDLYEPIKGALEYLWPRMVSRGIVLCDDYGSLVWPGAKRAVEEFAREQSLRPIRLSTGQAFFVKP